MGAFSTILCYVDTMLANGKNRTHLIRMDFYLRAGDDCREAAGVAIPDGPFPLAGKAERTTKGYAADNTFMTQYRVPENVRHRIHAQ